MTAEPRHAAQPRLCAQCLLSLRQRIAASPGDASQLIPCRHGPDDGVVVAVVEVCAGSIVSWSIDGPMAPLKAEGLALAYLNGLAAAGVPIAQAPTVQ